jgi:hypothetical protein
MRLFNALFCVLFAGGMVLAAIVPGSDFPYGRFQLQTNPTDNPFPGLGNYYSTLSKGIDTVMWNPASLGKLKNSQVNLALVSESGPVGYNKKYQTTDEQQQLGDVEQFKWSVYFTPDQSVSTPATREHTGHAIYQTAGTGLNFKAAHRLNDWLSFGIVERGDTNAAIDMSGQFTANSKMTARFGGTGLGLSDQLSINIDNSGYTTFVITPEGSTTYTKTLDQPVWSGFVSQTSTVPFVTMLEARNDVTVSAPLTLAGSATWKDFNFGLSFTPISANSNINNSARAVIPEGTPDMVLYQPNFDPSNEQNILNWADNPDQYGTEVGYKKNVVRVPAGEVIGEARYKGFYQASGPRLDLGGTYDLGDVLTLGLVFENLSGTVLNFRGTGRVAYVNSRIGSMEAPSLDPTKDFNWAPFADTFKPVDGTENYFLEEELTAVLPKKMRVGLALHKPILIALDYESNSSPIKVKYEDTVTKQAKVGTVSNITLLRLGTETRLFALPLWLRGSTALMLKPSFENFDQKTMDSIEKAFKFGVLPVALEFGADANAWGVTPGVSTGFNLTPLISMAQLDTLNLDLSKMVYYNVYAGYGYWQLSYLCAVDPGTTAGAYANRADQNAKFDPSFLKYIQTVKVSYNF